MGVDHKAQFFYGFQTSTYFDDDDLPKGLETATVGNDYDSDHDIFFIVEGSEFEAYNFESVYVGENPHLGLPTEAVVALKKFRDELVENNKESIFGEIGWYLGLTVY